MSLTITDTADGQRYEAREGDDLAGFLEYVLKRGRLALVHTETVAGHEGHGVAAQLVRFALDDARRRELRVIPICPYVKAYLERHPDQADIVVGASRG